MRALFFLHLLNGASAFTGTGFPKSYAVTWSRNARHRSDSPILKGKSDASESVLAPAKKFLDKNFFVVGMVTSIGLAALNPALGARGGPLKPELTVDTLVVACIFLLSGLALPTNELKSAAANIKLNSAIQGFNLLLFPLLTIGLVAPVMRALPLGLGIEKSIIDGYIAMNCLPTSVNMCIVLTGLASGNVATSLFSAVLGNLLGVFVSPLLIFKCLGAAAKESSSLSYLAVISKLGKKVLLPVLAGQGLRYAFPKLVKFRAEHKKAFGRASEFLLLSIIYATFCEAFSKVGSTNQSSCRDS